MADELKIVKVEPLRVIGMEPDQPSKGADSTSLAMKAGKVGVDVASGMATELAQNPNVPKVAAKIGRVVGGIAPVAGGFAKGGPAGAAIGFAGSAHGAWTGGKTGWFTGKLAQKLAGPVATALEFASPVLNVASGAAGVGDLAQMADPNRKDIGFMGVGSTPDPIEVVRAAMQKGLTDMQAVKSLVQSGMPQGEAIRTVMNLRAKGGR